ncbi:MAG: hypothetical protein V5B33_08155 [Candidatus Accumulibacter sp. UW20]|jgi:hypothetical protein
MAAHFRTNLAAFFLRARVLLKTRFAAKFLRICSAANKSQDLMRSRTNHVFLNAIAELSRLDTPEPDRPAFALARRVLLLNGDRERVKKTIAQMVMNQQQALDILFSGSDYSDEQIDNFAWDGVEDLISPAELLDALQRTPGFEDGHRRLIELLRRPAKELSAAADQSP